MERRKGKGGLWSKLKRFVAKTFKRPIVPSAVMEMRPEAIAEDDSIVMSTVQVKDREDAKIEPNTKADDREARQRQFKLDQDRMSKGTYSFHARFAKEYRLRCLLGQGSFGFVFLATQSSTDKPCAVKFILRDRVSEWLRDDEYGMVPKEVHLLSSIKSCNNCLVIKLIDYMSDPRYCYMITEQWGVPWSSAGWVAGPNQRMNGWRGGWRMEQSPGDLFECIESHAFLPPSVINSIFHQLLSTVIHLHDQHGIVHRDLKDENVVVDADYRIKLIDFGSAVSVRSEVDLRKQFHGTMAFAAPEIIRMTSHNYDSSTAANQNRPYDPLAAEVWSLGVLLYTMAMRRAPFADPWSILYTEPTLPLDDTSAPPGMYDLIRKCLVKDASKRIRVHAIQSHPWMRKFANGASSGHR